MKFLSGNSEILTSENDPTVTPPCFIACALLSDSVFIIFFTCGLEVMTTRAAVMSLIALHAPEGSAWR